MAKVTIKREGFTIDADLTLDELKELVGVNGHKPRHQAPVVRQPAAPPKEQLPLRPNGNGVPAITASTSPEDGDVNGLLSALSERTRLFIRTLHQHPSGIVAADLARVLGFNLPAQMGGSLGPGLVRPMRAHGFFKVADMYTTKARFDGSTRILTYYPGPLVEKVVKAEKPA